ncbi:type II secretion system protein J [Actinoplanes sp. N902-109]|uniref:PulJ/GspJ family protein n=1 Tax=Actinoplanes sp. (strain N902-109) TaxID=649831 RepID=UPI0005A12BE9|nr:hypothetical protein [Actinoplanes sp. N902-109]
MTRERHRGDDEGVSLVEVMVTLGVMGVLMVLFTGAVLQVFRTTTVTDALSEAQQQLTVAFQRFDKELRYASWIADPSDPAKAANPATATQYVEFAGAVATDCYQLRLAPGADGLGVLQLLNWTAGTPPKPGTPGQTIASDVVMDGKPAFLKQGYGTQPFASATPAPGSSSSTVVGRDFSPVFQRLEVQLTTRATAGTAHIDTTFTALNTSNSTSTTNTCSEGRP